MTGVVVRPGWANRAQWSYPDRHPAGHGPWADEPDKVQWIDKATRMDCLIVRTPAEMGHLCGYVGVLPGHPWHGWGYDAITADAHGGVNFSARCDEDDPTGICHVPAAGRPADVWWFGFDCAHYQDLSPGIVGTLVAAGFPLRLRGTYRTVEYVRREVTALAGQLAMAGP